MKYFLYTVVLVLFYSCSTKTKKEIEKHLACDLCLVFDEINSPYVRSLVDSSLKKKLINQAIQTRDSLEKVYGKGIDSARLECENLSKVKEYYSVETNKEFFAKLFFLNSNKRLCWNEFEFREIENSLKNVKKFGEYYFVAVKGRAFYLKRTEYLCFLQCRQKASLFQVSAYNQALKENVAEIKKINKGRVTDLDILIFSYFVNKENNAADLWKIILENKEIQNNVDEVKIINNDFSIYDIVTEEENERRKLEVDKIKELYKK